MTLARISELAAAVNGRATSVAVPAEAVNLEASGRDYLDYVEEVPVTVRPVTAGAAVNIQEPSVDRINPKLDHARCSATDCKNPVYHPT